LIVSRLDERKMKAVSSSFGARRLTRWWTDVPSNPGRASLTNLHVQRLLGEICPECNATDLGGTMSLNVRIEPLGLVLRVHQPFVSRRRLLAVQEVRHNLTSRGLVVPIPANHRGHEVFRCGDRWAELENYIPHKRPKPSTESYSWMFGAMGRLHGALAATNLKVTRPVLATYAPPSSLRRWLPITEAAVRHDPETREIVRLLYFLQRRLRAQWIPERCLPRHLIHGDARLGNLCRTEQGEPLYLDFGFLALRPRIHELAYSLDFMVRALDGNADPDAIAWKNIPSVIHHYESTAPFPLSPLERKALPAYAAAVPLYFSALAGFMDDPPGRLRASRPFLRLSEWLLAHPQCML
jgi:Ser/Thr protein kinase RdoA (MazF antagonist)